MFRFLIVLLFCFAFVTPLQPAQAGWLEFFFPSLRDTTNDPSNTLQAPFADVADETEESAHSVVNSGSSVPLKFVHRSAGEIAEWIEMVVSETMSFKNDYRAELDALKPYYDEAGWAQYKVFLEDSKIMSVLQSQKYEVHSYVSEVPLLLNKGVVQERYRWLYSIPLTVSFVPRGVKDYKDIEPESRDMVLRIQVGRSTAAENDLGLLIESWSGKLRKRKK